MRPSASGSDQPESKPKSPSKNALVDGDSSDNAILFFRGVVFEGTVLGNLRNSTFGLTTFASFFFCFFADVFVVESMVDEAGVSSRFRFEAAVFILSRQLWQFFQ